MTVCPQCHRNIKTHRSRFGDEVYNRHKMMRLGDYNTVTGKPAEIREEWQGENHLAAPLYNIDCPMSGQVVE